MSPLYRMLSKSIDDRLSSDKQKNLYVSTSPVRRNRRCWLADVPEMTAIPLDGLGTLVTEQQMVFATHYGHGVGATIRFATMKDELVERKIVRTDVVTGQMWNTQLNGPDVTIALLDKPVPSASIRPMPLLAIPFSHHFVTDANGWGLPAFYTDQEGKALVGDVMSLMEQSTTIRLQKFEARGYRPLFREVAQFFDSGRAVCLMAQNVPVMLGHAATAPVGFESNYLITLPNYGNPGYRAEIEKVIAAQGVGFKLRLFDLSRLATNVSLTTDAKLERIPVPPLSPNAAEPASRLNRFDVR